MYFNLFYNPWSTHPFHIYIHTLTLTSTHSISFFVSFSLSIYIYLYLCFLSFTYLTISRFSGLAIISFCFCKTKKETANTYSVHYSKSPFSNLIESRWSVGPFCRPTNKTEQLNFLIHLHPKITNTIYISITFSLFSARSEFFFMFNAFSFR